ncbi:MAG: type VI secretion system baseplate subunit TssG [Arcobacteraceae bacterium]|nr:type VI secretion system baseplate subunit TssG [Arcobacteraceae bacterium]
MNTNLEQINQSISKVKTKISLPQATRIALGYLQKIYPKLKVDEIYRKIRFKSNPSLAFQKSELANIEFIDSDDGIYVEFTVNFLSMFGSSSPLPSHYSEMILRDIDKDGVLRDFVDIFNHNLQKLIYPIWHKHKYSVVYQKDFKDYFSKYIISIIGLYSEHGAKNTKLDIKKLAPYIGILSMNQKSAGMLLPILKHYLDHKQITINQCVLSTVQIPSWQYGLLGSQNSTLGVDMLIGENIKSKSIKFSIELQSVKWDDLFEYSKFGTKLAKVNDLINFMLNEPLVYDVILNVPQKDVVNSRLSDEKSSYLGINSVIGEVKSNLSVAFS